MIESGLYPVSDKPGLAYNTALDHRLHKRAWLRKPQCSFSWDWSPRLVNVGIWRPVRLEWSDSVRIDCVTVYPELSEDLSRATVHARVFVDNPVELARATLRLIAVDANVAAEQEVELPLGTSVHSLSANISDPRLWWPRPHGDQPLYRIVCEVEIAGRLADRVERRTGIRSVRINQAPHPETGEYFIIEINGRRVFAKGGNWVPPDTIYARADAERYRRLVQLAADANFNTLRVWGGGLYADHAFLDACDELGIMVWHDFAFACSKYPGDDPEFLDNVRREVAFVIRDLSPHPSLVVWCGNNEIEWGVWEWGYDRDKSYPDYALYHHEIPRILSREDPSRPYWPSSPYSTGHRHPNDKTTGDQHPWSVSLGDDGPNFWAYRTDASRFPNEGGFLGASSLATLHQFLPEDQRRLFSPVWEFHDNACNFWRSRGVAYRAIEHWLGQEPEKMRFEDYVFYSAVLQSEALQEYINNFRRRMFSSSSAIFWMYNDCWPASHGWTIVDYYLRRKLAYFPVRRAFAPVHVIPALVEDRVVIFGVNDTPNPWHGEVRYGLFKLSGGLPLDRSAAVTLPPNAATAVGDFSLSDWRSLGQRSAGAFAILLRDGRTAAQNRLFTAPFKDLELPEPRISIERRGGCVAFSSPTFVWAVCLDVDGEAPLSDDVFDLVPGIDYEIDWPKDAPLPTVKRCASPLSAIELRAIGTDPQPGRHL